MVDAILTTVMNDQPVAGFSWSRAHLNSFLFLALIFVSMMERTRTSSKTKLARLGGDNLKKHCRNELRRCMYRWGSNLEALLMSICITYFGLTAIPHSWAEGQMLAQISAALTLVPLFLWLACAVLAYVFAIIATGFSVFYFSL